MHSILGLISATCGAKFDCEPLSHLTLRLWVRPLPSSKPFKNVDGEHTVGPWLIRYDEVLQKSVDFNRSLLFHSVEGSSRPVFGLRLALQPLVSASNGGIISNKGVGSGTLSRARCILLYCGWRVGGGVNASAVNGTSAHTK